MGWGLRLAKLMDRGYDRMRHPDAFGIGTDDVVTGGFDDLRDSKYAVVVTFRRNGDTVPSPVWIAVDAAGRAYTKTGAHSGKVKRVRNDPRALVAPSTVRGRPKGPVRAGSARILPKEEWAHAEATMAASFGLGRQLYERLFPMSDEATAYIEIAPRG
ncbi:MAG TPA: PPOX class F420-dependent oxidoreductase [Acidimicrobiales bacterium]|nr:PPOX class F420-dependent oxidoreductase [Acidimicrobiales bacterium]